MIAPATDLVINPLTKLAPKVFSFGGIDATETFLNLHPSLTDSQEREIISQLRTAGRGMPWWVGDFACHYQRRMEARTRWEKDAAAKEGRKPKEYAYYADILAEAWGISSSGVRNAAAVSNFFPIATRLAKLTWRHHAEAMRAVGASSKDLKKACEILAQAAKDDWSCADLREQALPTHQPSTQAPSQPEDNAFEFLDTADRWVNQSHDRIKAIDADRAATLLTRFHALVEFIDHLRALTGLKAEDMKNLNSRFASTAGK